jgi:hypothetical protein
MCDLTLPCVLVETRTPEGKIIREAQHGQGKIIRLFRISRAQANL